MIIKLEKINECESGIRTDDNRLHRVSCSLDDLQFFGVQLKVMKVTPYGTILKCNIRDAILLIESAAHLGKKEIAIARGQIEDAGCEMQLSDRDVAVMDTLVREHLVEIAREIDDPFNDMSHHTRGKIFLPTPDLDYLFDDYEPEA